MKNSITAGIDFGNQQSILSIPTEHGIDIILNESSNRKTPTLVGYQEGRRLAGEFAQQQQMMNISNTITQFKHLINLQYNPQMLEQINKEEFPFKLTTLSDSTLGILLDNGEVLAFEQIIGFYLKSLFEIIQKRNPQIQHIVLAVPSNWTEIQRQSILNSALIANVKIAELLDSATASAVSLVKIHGDRFSEEEGQNVLFIEIGDSSMSSTIAKVTKKSIEMKSNFTDNSINGQIFTEKLEKYLIEKVAEKYKIDPKTNKRATIRLKQACEKVKKILSSNPVVLFEVPSLMNDIDVSITVKRDEFNELIKSFIPKIKENIELTIQKAGISKEDISYVEIVGGSTRIPLIKESIKEILGKEAKMSLDLDECFAIGAGFIASKIDGNDIGIEFVNDHCCPYSIDVKVDQEKELLNIFKENESKLSSSNKILLPISQQKTFTFYCNQSEIGKLDIDANNQEETEVEVLVSIDSFGIIRVENVAFKNGKKCMFSYTSQKSLSEEEISKYSKIEEIQDKQDKMEIEIDNTKNELESLIFTTENELKTIKNEEFQKKLESVHNWFDEHEFERMSLNEYESKVAEIKSIKSELNKSHEYENKKTKLAEIKQNLSKSLQSVKSDTERNQMEESLSLQSEMSKLISLIDEKMKLDKEELIQTDIDNLLKESLNIEEKVKKLSQIQIPKKNRNKRRRRQNRRAMNGQRFDPWSPFGRRNNFFGGFMGGPWSNDEYDYEYCYDDDSDCQVQKQQQERRKQDMLQKQEQERKRQEMLQKQEQERKRQEMLIEQEKKRQFEKENRKRAQIEQERTRRSKANNYTNSDDDDFSYLNQIKKEAQIQLQLEEEERKQQEMQKRQEQEKMRQIEMENRRRAQIEQERINRAKEAEMYRRSRAMNDPWSSAMYSPYGRSINPQRQSVQPRQYQQQRRVMPGYGYTWGF